MDLRIVKPGCALLWPAGGFPKTRRHRGGPGYVVDLDAPLEREWTAGQERKLVTIKKALEMGVIDEGDELVANLIEEPLAHKALIKAGHEPRKKPRDLETRLDENAREGTVERISRLATDEIRKPSRTNKGRRSARRVSVRVTKDGNVIIQHPRKFAEREEVAEPKAEKPEAKPARKPAAKKKAARKPRLEPAQVSSSDEGGEA